jgi:hypothetical protein
MTPECLSDQKETIQKYRKITRIDQARMILAVQDGQTQESVAEQNNVPRTTLEYWIKRRQELKWQHDPEVTAFFESPAGITFLHRLPFIDCSSPDFPYKWWLRSSSVT